MRIAKLVIRWIVALANLAFLPVVLINAGENIGGALVIALICIAQIIAIWYWENAVFVVLALGAAGVVLSALLG